MKESRTEIEIKSSPVRVWESLMDFPAFPDWNPFIRQIEGEPTMGSKLEVFLQASGTKGMTFRPRVKRIEANHELRWLGHLGIPGLFDGAHVFEIHAVGPDRVRFVQREEFRGILVPFLARMLERDTRREFEDMNRALRARVEGTGIPNPKV